MNKNLGTADIVIRIVVAFTLFILIYFRVIQDSAAIAASIIALLLLVNACMGSCGIYSMLGISTRKTCPYKPEDKKSN